MDIDSKVSLLRRVRLGWLTIPASKRPFYQNRKIPDCMAVLPGKPEIAPSTKDHADMTSENIDMLGHLSNPSDS
jgi:hypothetical protein